MTLWLQAIFFMESASVSNSKLHCKKGGLSMKCWPHSFLRRKNLENLLNYKGEKSTFTVIRNAKLLSTAFIYSFPPSEIRIINRIQIKIFNFVMLLKANLLITVTNQHKRDICKLIIIHKLQINYESQSLVNFQTSLVN